MSGVASRKVDVDEKAVLRTLVDNTYQETGDLHGISRGKVYSIALAHNARKNEERIAERKAERLNRQREMLEQMIASLSDYVRRAKTPSLSGYLDETTLNGREESSDKEQKLDEVHQLRHWKREDEVEYVARLAQDLIEADEDAQVGDDAEVLKHAEGARDHGAADSQGAAEQAHH